MWMQRARVLAAALACGFVWSAQAQSPSHLYLLNDASDALGGPALSGLGGAFGTSAYGQTGYSFGANQGLSVAGAVNSAVYTLDFAFAFDELGGYRRLVDFLDRSSDTGLYVLNDALNFYNIATGAPAFTAQQMTRVTVTRDATGLFSGYVNGALAISFDDSSSALASFSGPSQVAYFFADDTSVGGEAGAGFVDYIRIYNTALSGAEVANLPSPVPEPDTWLLMLGGLAAAAARARRIKHIKEDPCV